MDLIILQSFNFSWSVSREQVGCPSISMKIQSRAKTEFKVNPVTRATFPSKLHARWWFVRTSTGRQDHRWNENLYNYYCWTVDSYRGWQNPPFFFINTCCWARYAPVAIWNAIFILGGYAVENVTLLVTVVGNNNWLANSLTNISQHLFLPILFNQTELDSLATNIFSQPMLNQFTCN